MSHQYCFICEIVKQPRVHHCKVCKKCVDRMDHHCPWVSNCIGRNNIQYFLQLLIYNSTLLLVLGIIDFIYLFKNISSLTNIIYYSVLGKGIYSLLIGIVIFYLLLYQIKIIKMNLTTIEEGNFYFRKNVPFFSSLKMSWDEVYGRNYSLIQIFFPVKKRKMDDNVLIVN